jgi:hypothetical protein
LQETFANSRQAGLKLNPEKCVFGVKKGKFISCLVSTKGIEANPSKIKAILRMEPPSTKKGAQRLAGRLASLNKFISRSAERNLPFFEILKSAEVFQWGPAQQKAFEELKQYLIDLTILTPPALGAPLLLFVAASHSAVSATLVQEKLDGQARKQAPIYFVSVVLSPSKKNYTELEKVLYAVLMASRKLQHYFQAYHIIVASSQPLKDIMQNREATGRIGKWAAELNEFTIDYVHRSSIQSQALADFIADWTLGAQEEEVNKDAEAWTVFYDGSWGTFGAGAAAVLVAPSKVRTCYAAKLDFSCINNIVEYEALLLGLHKLRANGIIMTGIMKLIFNQPRGKWPDELIKLVWSHNTTISRSTGFTPFKLLFGDKAITPEEAKARSIRIVASAEDEADYSVAKDAIEGTRLQAVENINKYQAETVKWRDRKVRLKKIKPGHLVLRRVANPDIVGKLQLKWEGPFLVVSSSRPDSYRLKDMDDNDIPRSWNVDELRRYYV